uniref:1-alkyl-2-acetylglycerophosphocholine esterase n=1 Tax=Bos taurus TaxID=9913 RepID=F6R298_BOVIN
RDKLIRGSSLRTPSPAGVPCARSSPVPAPGSVGGRRSHSSSPSLLLRRPGRPGSGLPDRPELNVRKTGAQPPAPAPRGQGDAVTAGDRARGAGSEQAAGGIVKPCPGSREQFTAASGTIYSAIGIDLASHGFIVAAVEHRDGSASSTYYFKDQSAVEIGNKSWLYLRTLKRGEEEFPLRNEQLRQRAKECSQALSLILDIDHGRPVMNVLDLEFDVEQLKDSIDRDKIAIIGHSFGGATVIQTLSEDQRFRCGIALDAWMFPVGDEVYSRIPQPLFFINSERFQYPSNIIRMKKCFLPDRERKMITIRGSVHQNFVDFTFATSKIIGYLFTLKGDIDSNVAISLSNKASLAFLQKHLGLQKDFDQWDSLVEGEDHNLIPGTNINTTNHQATLQNSTGIERPNLD